MTKTLRFDDEAIEELEAAAQWYEARRKNLGIEFAQIVREGLLRIAERPQTWPVMPNVPEHLEVRRLVLPRFPYSIVFAVIADEIRVLAIAHESREPGFWRGRR